MKEITFLMGKIIKTSDNQLSDIRNKTVGFVFQNFKLIENNTILENISIPLIYAGMGPQVRKERAINTLHDVGLYNKEHFVPNKLSGATTTCGDCTCYY